MRPAALVAYDHGRLDDLVAMWRASFEHGVGIVDWHPIAEQRAAFLDEVLPANDVRLAMLDGQLVGFAAASRDSVAQLHVRAGFHRRGFGSMLLALAKQQSAGRLWLYTFACNTGARAIYEHHWRLDDVRYEWTAPDRPT